MEKNRHEQGPPNPEEMEDADLKAAAIELAQRCIQEQIEALQAQKKGITAETIGNVAFGMYHGSSKFTDDETNLLVATTNRFGPKYDQNKDLLNDE